MKILAVGRNYAEHIEELKNERPQEPVIFTKPDTALLKENAPFYLPDYTKNVHHEVEIILRVGREGKSVQEKHALSYLDGIGIGLDFTARDLQDKAKKKGLPWTLAKGFNGSAPVSHFSPLSSYENIHDLNFRLEIDNEIRQRR